jgi:3-oxoacyl-[acyl-carrier protein] reductase
MKYDLDKKIALITGGTEGLGFATAELFIKEGAKSVICAPEPDMVKEAAARLSVYGCVLGYPADVSVKDDVERLVERTVQEYGRIDVLINNAGIIRDAQFYKMSDDKFLDVINVNLIGTYYLTKAVVPYMMRQRYGKIINISSISAFNGNFGQSNYAASKAGVVGMTRVLGKELGKYNINVNAVLPGSVESRMSENLPPDIQKMRVEATALRRMGKASDIAHVNAFLASEGARHITAQTIVVDGGRS